jgi:hypothetical protein
MVQVGILLHLQHEPRHTPAPSSSGGPRPPNKPCAGVAGCGKGCYSGSRQRVLGAVDSTLIKDCLVQYQCIHSYK